MPQVAQPQTQAKPVRVQPQGPGLWERTTNGLKTSVWITNIWEWFLSLATRAIQPVLFGTVMYNLASSYPGVKTPGPSVDLAVFLAQNAALDIASFGLPGLARQALEAGNVEGSEETKKLGQHLFYIMIANLVYAGIEHILTGIDANVKLVVGLIFVVVRSYYAIKYSKVMHSLKASGVHEQSPQQDNQAIQQVDALKLVIDTLRTEVKALSSQQKVVPEPIDYQKIVDHVASLAPIQSVPEPLNYQEIAQNIVPLLVPPPVPTSAEIIEELKPFLDSLKNVPVQKVQTPAPVAQPFIVPAKVQNPGQNDQIYVPASYTKSTKTQDTPGTKEQGKIVQPATKATKVSVPKSVPAKTAQDTTDTLLRRGYNDMVKKGLRVSGRSLAAYTNINKNIACPWFKDNIQGGSEDEDKAANE